MVNPIPEPPRGVGKSMAQPAPADGSAPNNKDRGTQSTQSHIHHSPSECGYCWKVDRGAVLPKTHELAGRPLFPRGIVTGHYGPHAWTGWIPVYGYESVQRCNVRYCVKCQDREEMEADGHQKLLEASASVFRNPKIEPLLDHDPAKCETCRMAKSSLAADLAQFAVSTGEPDTLGDMLDVMAASGSEQAASRGGGSHPVASEGPTLEAMREAYDLRNPTDNEPFVLVSNLEVKLLNDYLGVSGRINGELVELLAISVDETPFCKTWDAATIRARIKRTVPINYCWTEGFTGEDKTLAHMERMERNQRDNDTGPQQDSYKDPVGYGDVIQPTTAAATEPLTQTNPTAVSAPTGRSCLLWHSWTSWTSWSEPFDSLRRVPNGTVVRGSTHQYRVCKTCNVLDTRDLTRADQ